MDLTFYTLITISFAVPAALVVYGFKIGRPFSLISVYSAIFALEISGGAIKTCFQPSARGIPFETEALISAMLVACSGFGLLLIAYASTLTMRAKERSSYETSRTIPRRIGQRKYVNGILVALALTTVIGMMQHYQRISSLGSVEEFLATAYRHRVGTMGDTATQNAVIVLANIVGNAAVAFACIGLVMWRVGALTRTQRTIFATLLVVLLLRQWATMFRSTIFFTGLALFATYAFYARFTARKYMVGAVVAVSALVAIDAVHQYMYYLTAEWERQKTGSLLLNLIAPQGHLETLTQIILQQNEGGSTLNGQGLKESVFFFIPRIIWASKAPADEYGTLLVQTWARLPDWYQIAITNVGELTAHFGNIGVLGMLVFGVVYGLMEKKALSQFEWAIGVTSMVMPRLLVDMGMGLSAFSNTILNLFVFLVIIKVVRVIAGGSRDIVPRLQGGFRAAPARFHSSR
jgi:hypothetical protein